MQPLHEVRQRRKEAGDLGAGSADFVTGLRPEPVRAPNLRSITHFRHAAACVYHRCKTLAIRRLL